MSDPAPLVAEASRLIGSLLTALQAYRGPSSDGLAQARALKELRIQTLRALEHRAPVVLGIAADGVWMLDQAIRAEDPRTTALARALYQDGVRQIELNQGLGEREVVAWVEAVLAALRTHPDGEDFLSCLWRHDTACLRAVVADPELSGEEAAELESLLLELEEAPGKLVPARTVEPQIPGLDALRAEAARERAAGLEPRILSAALEGFLFAEDDGVSQQSQAVLLELLDTAITTKRWDRAQRVITAVVQCGGVDGTGGASQHWLEKAATPIRLRELLLAAEPKASSVIAAFGPAAASGLLATLPTLESQGTRKLVIELLSSMPGWDLSLLEPLLRTERPGIALDAMEILNRARRPATFAVLAEAYRHPHPSVRAALADSLALFGHERSFALACQLLEDLDPRVRAAAARTLGRATHKDAARHLERSMQSPVFDAEWPEVKEAMVAAYVRLEGARAVQWLRALYHKSTGLLPRKDRDETAEIVLKGLQFLGAEPGPKRSRAN